MSTVPYTVYDLSTGEIIRSGQCKAADYALQAKVGQGMLPMRADDSFHAVEIPWDGIGEPSLVDKVIVPPTLDELKANAKARAAERRWQIECGGVSFYGSTIATDDRSKLLIASAAEQARIDPDFVTRWKTEEGPWVDLNAAGILAIYGAVFAHVRACFAREEELCGLIDDAEDAAAMSALTGVIVGFWPES